MPRRKFGNVVTQGYHSKKEHRRAQELSLLSQIGAISDLKEQVRFEVIPKQDGERAAHYIADFTYVEGGTLVAEDVKGYHTPVWILKRKLMLLVHGIRVRVT